MNLIAGCRISSGAGFARWLFDTFVGTGPGQTVKDTRDEALTRATRKLRRQVRSTGERGLLGEPKGMHGKGLLTHKAPRG